MKVWSMTAWNSLSLTRPVSVGDGNIGVNKIVTLEEQRLRAGLGQGVGETVSVVQGRWVAAFAKVQPGVSGESALFQIHGNNFDAGAEGRWIRDQYRGAFWSA